MVKNDRGDPIRCPVCLNEITDLKNLDDGAKINCPRCGVFGITGTLYSMFRESERWLGPQGSRQRSDLSSWIREIQPKEELNSNFPKPEMHDMLGDLYRAVPKPHFFDKVDKLLLALRRETRFIGERIEWFERPLYHEAVSWSLNEVEFANLLDYMKDYGLIEGGVHWIETNQEQDLFSGHPLKIAPGGWARIQELDEIGSESQQGFIACKFGDKTLRVANMHMATAVTQSGYQPLLIINKEHAEKIDDQIFAEIKRSRFIIADFTGQRQNVYYEAGYARGLGLPVIWTCAKDDIDNLHFDIRQYNCLEWEPNKLEDFQKRLRYRIEAIMGKGPNPTPKEG